MKDLINLVYSMNNTILKFKSPWDTSILLSEWNRDTANTFSKLNEKWEKTWSIGSYGKSIADQFKGEIKIGYYFQPKGTDIKPHRDTGCKTRINVVLLGGEQTLYINNQEHVYDCALINVNKYEHYLKEAEEDRLLFSIIFLDSSFETVYDIIKSNIEYRKL